MIQNKKPPSDNRRRLSYVPCLDLAYQLGLEQRKSLKYSINELAQNYKKYMKSFDSKAIIFDLDGTLIVWKELDNQLKIHLTI